MQVWHMSPNTSHTFLAAKFAGEKGGGSTCRGGGNQRGAANAAAAVVKGAAPATCLSPLETRMRRHV